MCIQGVLYASSMATYSTILAVMNRGGVSLSLHLTKVNIQKEGQLSYS